MKKWVPLLLLGTLVFLAHDRRPLLEAHEARLYLHAAGADAVTDAALFARPEWAGLELHDFFVITTTADAKAHTLVSFGFGNYIKVIDEEWAKQAFGLSKTAEGR